MASEELGWQDFKMIEPLDEAAFRSLLRRVEQGPPEIIRLILQELNDQFQSETLHALMLVGPNVYSQLSAFIHAKLEVDLVRDTEQQIRQLLTVSWLKYVQTLLLFDNREDIPNPPQGQYSAVIELLIKLSNLHGARVYLRRSYQAVNALILDLLSAAPLLLHLGYMEMDFSGSNTGLSSEEASLVLHKCVRDEPSLENLRALVTLDTSSRALLWMINSFSRASGTHTGSGNLVTLQLDVDSHSLREILSFIVCQANTLKKLHILRSSSLGDEAQRDQCFPVSMLKFEVLSCSSHRPCDQQRYKMDDCAVLLHFIEAPALHILGCGYLLDCHISQICRSLAGKWLSTSPGLRLIVAGHIQTSFSNKLWSNTPYDALVVRNLEAVKNVFAGRVLELLSYGTLGYSCYFDKQIYG